VDKGPFWLRWPAPAASGAGIPGGSCLASRGLDSVPANLNRSPASYRRQPVWAAAEDRTTRYGARVGFYREHVLPRLVDRACGTAAMTGWRSGVTAGLRGRVVEIGFGSGLNVEHYPADLDVVLAVEPAEVARRLAARRIAASTVPVEHIGLDGQSIPLDDASCDSALSTFTLCTVPDAARALIELRRVLRPGGEFHFLEHGLAPDPEVVVWQRRFEPWQRRFADGCHLTRDIPGLVTDAGFVIDQLEQRYAKGPRPWSWFTTGVAISPA
jgi:SAM-dependent methyltransferase